MLNTASINVIQNYMGYDVAHNNYCRTEKNSSKLCRKINSYSKSWKQLSPRLLEAEPKFSPSSG